MTRPNLLVLDEPFANLDPRSRSQLAVLLHDLNRRFGTTIIASSHDLVDVADLSTRIGQKPRFFIRSLITLKALTYSSTGGMVAAATTSLPEWLGGVRNWDYRYTWLRDATFTLYALLGGGFHDEACAWREWLLRAVAGAPEQLQIMYGVAGERRLPELTLDWLPGYAGAAPVRVGSAAAKQHQLDIYGEVMDALHQARRAGIPPDPNAWRVQRKLLDFLESKWGEPDEGIWEVRGPRQHFTHSKVMAWVAFDRAVKAVEGFGADGPVERWREIRSAIHQEVCAKAITRQSEPSPKPMAQRSWMPLS